MYTKGSFHVLELSALAILCLSVFLFIFFFPCASNMKISSALHSFALLSYSSLPSEASSVFAHGGYIFVFAVANESQQMLRPFIISWFLDFRYNHRSLFPSQLN